VPQRPSFYLIDGHAHIYRSYFAPFRDLTSPSGEPTKAAFVFTQMLLTLVERRRPDYLAMVIDHGDETVFRKQIFPDYKANRQQRPDDFGVQERRILSIVRDAGLPILEAPGFEADDVIATLVERLKDDYDLYLVSKDKDLRQVLADHVALYDPTDDAVMDVPAMREKLGYGPELAVEVQTLIGDAIDNVPGIPGVGEKTAAGLLAEFGSIDGLYANLDKLKTKKKLVENLTKGRDGLALSRQLVTLKRDVAVPDFDVERCRFAGFDDKAAGQLEELGFRSMVTKMRALSRRGGNGTPVEGEAPPEPAGTGGAREVRQEPHPPSAPQTSEGLPYVVVDTPDALASFVAELKQQKRFAFDTETDALKPVGANLVGMAFS